MIARALIATAFTLLVGVALARTVPDVIDQPIGAPSGTLRPVPLRAANPDGGLVHREVTLRTNDAGALARVDELRISLGTYDTSPRLLEGTLDLGDGCQFRAGSVRLHENDTIQLRRGGTCTPLPHGARDVQLRLVFAEQTPRDARTALWSTDAPANTPCLLTIAIDGDTRAVAGRSISMRSPARISRAALLAFMWDVSTMVVWALFACAAALVMVGAAFVIAPGTRAIGAVVALASGLALGYAVLVPPLQAPDEPDHLLSYAKFTGDGRLAEATSVWARRIHFYRITFHADERFTPADRERAYELDWPPADVFAENVAVRSSTAAREWTLLRPVVPGSPPHALLLFRCAGALVFGGALGLAGAVLLQTPGGALFAVVPLLLPTLPFFAMQMSELTFTLAAFLLAAAGARLMVHDSQPRLQGVLLGTGLALIAGGARNGWPSAMLIAALAAARIFRGSPDRRSTDAAWFWLGLALPSLVLFSVGLLWIPSPFYEQWTLASFDPRAGATTEGLLVVIAATAIGGWTLERVFARAPSIGAAATALARPTCALAAAVLFGSLLYSLWTAPPMLPTLEAGPPPDALTYVIWVLESVATAGRLRSFDFLTWTSLWGGFGWAGTILPTPVITLLTVVVSFAALLVFVQCARDREGRRAIMAVCALAGIAAAVAITALTSYGLHRNVHGRYLIGPCLLGLALLVAPALLDVPKRLPASLRAAALLAAVSAVHGFALVFLLATYFE